MLKEDALAIIERYLDDQLTNVDLKRFELYLEDEEFRAELLLQARLVDALRKNYQGK